MTLLSIGDIQIAKALEREGPFGPLTGLVADANIDALQPHLDWLCPNYLDPKTYWMYMSIHSYVIRTARHTILVDTCVGNHKNRPGAETFHMQDTPYLANLAAAGVKPEEVDFVMCTHLHVDHVGWNTRLEDGRWIPTFPNAKYLFAKKELAHWEAEAKAAGDDDLDMALVYQDSVLPCIEAGQVQVVNSDHQIEDGLWLEPFEGHTPGHVCLHAHSKGDKGLFTGDVAHHPSQIPFPEWNSGFCVEPEKSRATRRRMMEYLAESGAWMLPAHFVTPTHGHVIDDHGTFRFSPANDG